MAEYGFDVQCSKKASDAILCLHIFDIISLYCFSHAEIAEIATYPDTIQDLWLQSFTNSKSVMVKSKLLQSAKEYFRTFFPDDSMVDGLYRARGGKSTVLADDRPVAKKEARAVLSVAQRSELGFTATKAATRLEVGRRAGPEEAVT